MHNKKATSASLLPVETFIPPSIYSLLIFQSITWYFLQEQEFSAGQTKSSYFPGIWN